MRTLFWKGLKKSAGHTKSGTTCLLEHRDLLNYQSVWAGTGSRTGERDAVVAAVAFYGGRRMAEVPALHRKDVKPKGDFVEVHEKKQKNDPYRRGMRCWIPQFPRLGPLCPFGLLRAWLCQWDETWNQCVTEGSLFFVAASGMLRYCAEESPGGMRGPPDGKEGAAWLKFTGSVDKAVIQMKRGWESRKCMARSHAAGSEKQGKEALLEGAKWASMPGMAKDTGRMRRKPGKTKTMFSKEM